MLVFLLALFWFFTAYDQKKTKRRAKEDQKKYARNSRDTRVASVVKICTYFKFLGVKKLNHDIMYEYKLLCIKQGERCLMFIFVFNILMLYYCEMKPDGKISSLVGFPL